MGTTSILMKSRQGAFYPGQSNANLRLFIRANPTVTKFQGLGEPQQLVLPSVCH